MKITEIKLYVLEHPQRQGRALKLVQVPSLRRIQYTHAAAQASSPAR